jgi:hypothetical protein
VLVCVHLASIWKRYREFERQVESTGVRPAKSELVRRVVLEQVGRFTLADLNQQAPAASPQLIKKVLAELKRGEDQAGRKRARSLLGTHHLKRASGCGGFWMPVAATRFSSSQASVNNRGRAFPAS